MGKVKSQWLEYLSQVLGLSELELLDYSLDELNTMLATYEQALKVKVNKQDEYIDWLMTQSGWDVDVDEDSGHIFIVHSEIGGIA